MDQDRHSLEQEIQNTTQSLRQKIEKLEEKTRDTVANVSDGVKQTAETWKKGARQFSLKIQAQERPATVLVAAIGAGLLAGLKLAGRRSPKIASAAAGPSLARLAASTFVSQAAGLVIPVVVEVGANVLGDWAKKKYPNSGAYIEKLQSALGSRPSQPTVQDSEGSKPLPQNA